MRIEKKHMYYTPDNKFPQASKNATINSRTIDSWYEECMKLKTEINNLPKISWPQYPSGEYVMPGQTAKICICGEWLDEMLIDSISFNSANEVFIKSNSLTYGPVDKFDYPPIDPIQQVILDAMKFGSEFDTLDLDKFSNEVQELVERLYDIFEEKHKAEIENAETE